MSRPTNSPPSCQTRIPSTTPPMPTTDRIAPTMSILREPVYGTSRTSPIWLSTTAMMTTSSPKPTRHDRYVVTNPPSSGPIAAAIAAAAPTSAYACFWAAPVKLPWISDCIAGSSSEAPEPADDRPEDDDGGEALGQRHGQRADGVGHQPEHVGPLAADQVADLAVDQDERGRDQRLERDGGLHPAGRGVQVPDDRGDRHVHQRRVDHQDEHRHGQQDHQSAVPRARGFIAFVRSGTHGPPNCSWPGRFYLTQSGWPIGSSRLGACII